MIRMESGRDTQNVERKEKAASKLLFCFRQLRYLIIRILQKEKGIVRKYLQAAVS